MIDMNKLENIAMIWDRFITKLEVKTFSIDEITREHKRIKNLLGSVEEHKRIFLEAAKDLLESP